MEGSTMITVPWEVDALKGVLTRVRNLNIPARSLSREVGSSRFITLIIHTENESYFTEGEMVSCELT